MISTESVSVRSPSPSCGSVDNFKLLLCLGTEAPWNYVDSDVQHASSEILVNMPSRPLVPMISSCFLMQTSWFTRLH